MPKPAAGRRPRISAVNAPLFGAFRVTVGGTLARMSNLLSGTAAQRLAASTSLIVLVAANLIIGMLALRGNWGVVQLIVLYWFEALVIGGFNVLRLVVVGLFGEAPFGATLARWVSVGFGQRLLVTVIGVGFFVFKFASFALLVAASFLWASIELKHLATGPNGPGAVAWFGAAKVPMDPVIFILVTSHGVSFVWNFLIGREYRTQSVPALVFWPYARMAAVLAVVVLGLLVSMLFPAVGHAHLYVIVFVLLKTLADALSHRWEHRRGAVPKSVA
jgi:hypothetical protein